MKRPQLPSPREEIEPEEEEGSPFYTRDVQQRFSMASTGVHGGGGGGVSPSAEQGPGAGLFSDAYRTSASAGAAMSGRNDNVIEEESDDLIHDLRNPGSPTAPSFRFSSPHPPGQPSASSASPFGNFGSSSFGSPFSTGPFAEPESMGPPSSGGLSAGPPSAYRRSPSPSAHEFPGMPSNFQRVRRVSVSAESLVPSSANDEWTPPVYPKTPEQLQRLKGAIKENFLFNSLDEEQSSQVLSALNEKPIPAAGTRIITQGDVGDFFYVVERGEFDIFVNPSGAPDKSSQPYGNKVATVSAGGSFGELALMYNAPRAATIISTAPHSIVWSLDRVTFRRILMEGAFKRRRMYEAFLEEVPLLSSLVSYERTKICDALGTQFFEPGTTIIRQGDPGDNFYLLESGIADVYLRGQDKPVKTYTKGDYFGELALLNDEPRAASVVARGRVKVAYLGKDGFQRLLGPVADIMRRNDPRKESQGSQFSPTEGTEEEEQ